MLQPKINKVLNDFLSNFMTEYHVVNAEVMTAFSAEQKLIKRIGKA